MGNYGLTQWLRVQMANSGFVLATGGFLWCSEFAVEISLVLIFVVPFMQFYCLRIACHPSGRPDDSVTDWLLLPLFFLNVCNAGIIVQKDATWLEVAAYECGGYWILHSIFIIPFTLKSIAATFQRGFDSGVPSVPTNSRLNPGETVKLVMALAVTILFGYKAFDPSGDRETWLLLSCLGFLAYTVAIYKNTGKTAEHRSLALSVLIAIAFTAFVEFYNPSQQHSNLAIVTTAGMAAVVAFGNAFILFFVIPTLLSLFGLDKRLITLWKNFLSTAQRRREAKQREEAQQQVAALHDAETAETTSDLLDCTPPNPLKTHGKELADVQSVLQHLPGDRDFRLAASQLRVIDVDDAQPHPHHEAIHLFAYYRPFLVRYYTSRLHVGEEPSNLHESCRECLKELRRQHMIVDVEAEATRLRTQSEWDLKQAKTEDTEDRRREEERRRDEDDFSRAVADLSFCLAESGVIKADSSISAHEREAALESCDSDEKQLRSRIAALREKRPEFQESAVN